MKHKGYTILIVEDEKSIRDVLTLNLGMDGYNVITCDNGLQAIDIVRQHDVSLILMDVMLPKLNGIESAKQIKKKRPELPIVMLSALDQTNDRIKGLRAGADDYVNKPFNYEELLIRIEKQLQKKRIRDGNPEEIMIGKNLINLSSSTISNSKGTKQLTSKELTLLKYLYNNKNRVISREELLANVWGYSSFPNSRTVDNYISVLRKALTTEKGKREFIYSQRGIGYKLLID